MKLFYRIQNVTRGWLFVVERVSEDLPNFLVGQFCAPPSQPLTHYIFADSQYATSIQCHRRAKEQTRGSRQIRVAQEKGRGRARPRTRKRKVAKSKERSRSMFDTFWYNTREE
jgi:hypothetical protein